MNRNWNRVVIGGLVTLGGIALMWGSSMPQVMAEKPDLVVDSISVTNRAGITNTVVVACVISNRAVSGAALSSTTYIYLTTNATSAGLNNIGTHSVSALPAGSVYRHTNNIVIPANTILGTNNFIVVADKLNTVQESNENNNTNIATIVITAP